MARGKGDRTTFTYYQPGGSVTVFPSTMGQWLRVYSPGFGAPLTLTRGPLETSVIGVATLGRAAGDVVKFGGYLVDSVDGRIYEVRQIKSRKPDLVVDVGQVGHVFPDEFECGAPEAWWTVAAGTFVDNTGASVLQCAPPIAALPSNGAFRYQSVPAGVDFDVWTKLSAPTGGPSNIFRVLLGARQATEAKQGVYVGIKADGSQRIVRLDENPVLGVSESDTGIDATYVRLRRCGGNLVAYFAQLDLDPTTELDWQLIAPVSNSTFNSQARVGVGAYLSAGATDTSAWQFLRNWR